ncbi:MAG: 30S ribosome-binding factor RbfA [Planctomycetaceae bacterium]|nr:30S ribosome-binding factor RbfA [Planctomycetaceae bacterium]
MSSRRTLKAASAIKEVVSLAILTELRDPRIQNVTVTFVEISGDMRFAKVHVSVMGDEKQQSLCMHGLQGSAGFLQKRVNDRIDTRYTPRIQFVLDKGIKHAFKVSEILQDILPDDEETPDDAEDSAGSPSEEDTLLDEHSDDASR